MLSQFQKKILQYILYAHILSSVFHRIDFKWHKDVQKPMYMQHQLKGVEICVPLSKTALS